MAKIHVLNSDNNGHTRFIIHIPVLIGNNQAGLPWKDVFLASGSSGKTVLAVGTGPGQIDATEKASIDAGDIMELEFSFPATTDDIPKAQVIFDKMTTDRLSEIMAQYAYYGMTLNW